MTKTVTFIHASDLHLGAPFRGLRALSSTWADTLIKAIPDAYQHIIDTALAEQVDFVVFAGDIFDNARPSYADFHRFIEGLKRLEQAHIPVYFCTGNHDPYTSWQHDFASLPPNTFMFSAAEPDFFVYERDGDPLVALGGRSYYNQTWPLNEDISAGISRADAFEATGVEVPFVVGVIHTGLNLDPTRSPVDPNELMRRDCDYWACGHIHQRILMPETHPIVAFSGCPQGRDIKETGEHGVLKVTLSDQAPNEVVFIPTARVVWQRFSVDVSECNTIADIHELITDEEFTLNSTAHCQHMVCRITLVGKTKLHRELTPQVIDDLRSMLNNGYPFFFIDTIVNRTEDVIDRSLLQKEGLFPAVYLETIAGQRDNRVETLSFLEKQFYGRDLALPRGIEGDLEGLYDDAETMVLDLLGQGEVS